MIPHAEACRRLREYVSRYNSQLDAATRLGYSQGHLSEMLAGKRTIPDWLLMEIGLQKRRVWLYYDARETPVLPCGAQVRTHHDRTHDRRTA